MKNILVVDDEPHIIRVLKLTLERAGYHVESCSNGEQALSLLQTKQPDVLITDVQMPKMTGEELCKRISIEMPNRKFLIFVTTSRTEIEHREWSRQIDNLMFLEKPLSSRKLIQQLNKYFERSEAG